MLKRKKVMGMGLSMFAVNHTLYNTNTILYYNSIIHLYSYNIRVGVGRYRYWPLGTGQYWYLYYTMKYV